ncbi:anaerobic ribonucleoside-triphosphate reductase [Pseudochelatococcus sp. B33]
MNKMIDAHALRDAVQPAALALCDEERQRCEIWTRVMGYHRPVSSFNRGKKGEFHERRYFTEERARLG